MAARRLTAVACLILGVALAAPAIANARPNPGVWKGKETKWWTGSGWQSYSQTWRVSFRLEGGKVLRFRSAGYIPWTCSDGSTESTKAPWVKKAKLYRSGGKWRLRGKRTVYGSRKMTSYIKGSFSSTRRVKGKMVVKRQGCGAYRAYWTAKGPKPKPKPPTPNPDPGPDPGCIMAPIPTYPYYICLN